MGTLDPYLHSEPLKRQRAKKPTSFTTNSYFGKKQQGVVLIDPEYTKTPGCSLSSPLRLVKTPGEGSRLLPYLRHCKSPSLLSTAISLIF